MYILYFVYIAGLHNLMVKTSLNYINKKRISAVKWIIITTTLYLYCIFLQIESMELIN